MLEICNACNSWLSGIGLTSIFGLIQNTFQNYLEYISFSFHKKGEKDIN